jgi:cobalt-zinc-cadmium efflux system protein
MATFCVSATIAAAEVVGGVWTGSLALLADAGHMLFDLLALGIAMASLVVGARPADATHTWGYRRIEVLGALINGLLLIGVSVAIVWEAIHRWWEPEPLQVGAMMVVAGIGLVANLVSLGILGGAHHDLSVRGALLHVIGDTLSSVGVLIGGAIIWYTGYTRIDAVLSALIAIVLCVGSYRLLRDVTNILLEAAPPHINTEALRAAITEVEGVAHVHDMHLWSITTGVPALSAHVVLAPGPHDGHAVRARVEGVLSERFHLVHSTLQMEPQQAAEAVCTPWLTPPGDTPG